MRAVICLAGTMGAGKTTLGRELARQLPGSTVRAFGDVVRRRAADEGLPNDRASLQETGLRMIAEGWSRFVDRLLDDVEPGTVSILIIDGVRHMEAVDEIRRRFPSTPVRTVFLRLDPTTSEARLLERDGIGRVEHGVEAEVGLVEGTADLVVDGEVPIEESVSAVGWLIAQGGVSRE